MSAHTAATTGKQQVCARLGPIRTATDAPRQGRLAFVTPGEDASCGVFGGKRGQCGYRLLHPTCLPVGRQLRRGHRLQKPHHRHRGNAPFRTPVAVRSGKSAGIGVPPSWPHTAQITCSTPPPPAATAHAVRIPSAPGRRFLFRGAGLPGAPRITSGRATVPSRLGTCRNRQQDQRATRIARLPYQVKFFAMVSLALRPTPLSSARLLMYSLSKTFSTERLTSSPAMAPSWGFQLTKISWVS